MNPEKLQKNARKASILLKAMSNEHRLLILCRLVVGERSVGELVRLVGLSQSALSQHLARLRRDNLVRTRREAQTIHYALASDEAVAVLERLDALYRSADSRHVDGRADGQARRAATAAHP
jgi:ArsR family transcriptional regulator, virulence genes transcriptional regulator